ncbi:programmed cell death protein 4 [Daphnia magna]|uniref:programmed cell death protein 4 n=1 Tax=Daphnia magna TaxID=35525 RepID=UPI001401C854|nr:programmed cell death protein 4 [Daphnia magna]XP_032789950.1 programmed cell death protein 4 [Daphnia magna]
MDLYSEVVGAPIDDVEAPVEKGEGAETNGNSTQVASSVMPASASVDERLTRRAKRPSKYLTKHLNKEGSSSPNGQNSGGEGSSLVNGVRTVKNLRRPRNGYGRGLPKKGGAGGKGVWGKPGIELDAPEVMDEKDPNYDSDSLDNGDVRIETIVPQLTHSEINKHLEPIILEYYSHGDTKEVALALEDYNFGENRYLIAVVAIELAMDHKPSNREMTSVLLSDLYQHYLTEREMEKALDQLLRNLPDLVLDTPDAPIILGNYIARSVADDTLAPRFLQNYQGKVECDLAKQALARADVLLSMKHGMTRLDNVWGVGGGLRPVTSLVRSMGLLLQEYLISDDTKEAARCLQELEVPHFHHELVYESFVMALEANNEETENSVVKLLKSFYSSTIVTPDQMKNGIYRVLDDLDDICLDVPNAAMYLERLGGKCKIAGLIDEAMLQKCNAARGRKRFVSEGDGGRFKD